MDNSNDTRAAFDKTYGIRDDGQASFTCLNLECLPEGDLIVAREHPALHADYRRIAYLVLVARDYRKTGQISNAILIERKIDALYETLPDPLKW